MMNRLLRQEATGGARIAGQLYSGVCGAGTMLLLPMPVGAAPLHVSWRGVQLALELEQILRHTQ